MSTSPQKPRKPARKKKPAKSKRVRLRPLTDVGVAAALARHKGNLASVARHFGVTRQAVQKYVGDRPALGQVALDQREARVDRAESKLDDAVGKGEAWAVKYTLGCLGKHRGYIERQEITGADGGPVRTSSTINLRRLTDDELDALDNLIDRATPPDSENVAAIPDQPAAGPGGPEGGEGPPAAG